MAFQDRGLNGAIERPVRARGSIRRRTVKLLVWYALNNDGALLPIESFSFRIATARYLGLKADLPRVASYIESFQIGKSVEFVSICLSIGAKNRCGLKVTVLRAVRIGDFWFVNGIR